MAKKALIVKSERGSKFKVRNYYRCKICGRTRAYMRKYKVCRICFRELASKGQIPGIVKASW